MLRLLLLLSLLFGAAGFGAGLANNGAQPGTDLMSGDGTPAPPPRGN